MLVPLAVLVALLPVALADKHAHSQRHHDLALKMRDTTTNVTSFDKRTSTCNNARATWYDVGLGACGATNSPGDDIIALTVQMYGNGYPGPNCNKGVTIECNGKTAQATIMDECMGCPYCGIDMSTGLFQKFADLGAGVLTCNWWFNDAAPAPPAPPPPPPAPKTTSKKPAPAPSPTTQQEAPKPPPTTTHTPPSSTHKPTSSSTPSSSSHKESSSSSSSSSHSSSSVAPTPSVTGPQNIDNMYQAYMGIGKLILANQ